MSELYEIDPQLAAIREPDTGRNLLDPGDPNPLRVKILQDSPVNVALMIENGPEGLIELTISSDEPWVAPVTKTLCLLGSESRKIQISIQPDGDEELANLLFCWEGLDGPLAQSIIIVRKLQDSNSSARSGANRKNAIEGSFKLSKEVRIQEAKRLCELIESIGATQHFFNRAAEKKIYRQGGESALSLTEIETLFNRICCARKWTRETRLVEKLAAMMGATAEKKRSIGKAAFEEALQFAAQRGMPKKDAEEVCVAIILDRRWPVDESMLDRWFSARRKQCRM